MKFLLLLPIVILSFSSFDKIDKTYKVNITIKGFRNNKGKVQVALYKSADGYPTEPSKALMKKNYIINNNQCSLIFENLPEGVYAIACHHDENDNGKFDFNFLHIPTEGTGASNKAKGFMGPPKFNDAKFILKADMSQTITVNY